MSQSAIEALIERKVTEALAERVDSTTLANPEPISEEVQKRLDALEKRVGGQETERAEGLQFLLMAKQHQVRGEDASALRMYQLAQPHFPGNEKLMRKVVALQDRLREKSAEGHASPHATATIVPVVEQPQAPKHFSRPATRPIRKFAAVADDEDLSYHEAQTHAADEEDEEEEFTYRPRTKVRRPRTKITADSEDELADMAVFTTATASSQSIEQTPRTKHLLAVINSRDVSQIKLLKGVGAKRAEAIANCLCDLEMGEEAEGGRVASLGELGRIKGVGGRMVENMRLGLLV
jgi:hypothetical protein